MNLDPNQGNQDALVKQIVQALFSTPEFQFVQTLMKQQAGQGGAPGDAPNQQPQQPQTQVPQGGMGSGSPTGGGQGFDDDPGDNGDPNMANRQRYSNVDDADSIVERYQELRDEHTELVERYQALEQANRENMKQFGLMREAIVQLEQAKVDSDRTMAIKELYQLHPHFIDIEEEQSVTLYSHGNDMSAEAFDKHMERLTKLAQRSTPTTQMLPGGRTEDQTKEKYSADFTDRIIERYELEVAQGNYYSHAQIEAMLKAGK